MGSRGEPMIASKKFGGAQVPLDPPNRVRALIDHAAVDRVAEGVAAAERAVWQHGHAGQAQPLPAPRQAIAAAAQGVVLMSKHCGQRRVGELQPDHAGRFKRFSQVAGQELPRYPLSGLSWDMVR